MSNDIDIDIEIEIRTCSLLATAEQVDHWRTFLTAAEQARADRYLFEKHRRRFIVGRAHLRHYLADYLAHPPAAITLHTHEHGKLFVDHPTLQFNLSHSHELAVFAFGHGGAIGIDVEHVRPLHHLAGMAKRFFTTAEQAELFAQAEADQVAYFFRLWTCKEAYLKALGTGLTRSSRSFTVTAAPVPQLVNDDHDAAAPQKWQFAAYALPDNYCGYVCRMS